MIKDDKKRLNQMIQWRRHLHEYPEVSYKEFDTSRWLQDTIEKIGGFTIEKIGATSFIATIHGGGTRDVATIAFRSDIDALPVQEETGLPFASKNAGVMHACGHDAHMAMLLGLAQYLSEHQQEISGDVKLVFQAAEEIPPGGAREIVASGALKDVHEIYGFHIFPGHPVGHIGIQAGPLTAAQDVFRIILKGKGTHGAYPELGNDVILAAAGVVTDVNHIISRSISSFDNAVISFGQIHAGDVFNVIPGECFMEGNIRTIDSGDRQTIHKRLVQIVNGVANAYGVNVDVQVMPGYDPVINDGHCTKNAENAAIHAIGETHIFHEAKKMVSEDFAAYTKALPGCFMILGGGEVQMGYGYMNHHPRFNFDEQALLAGLKVDIELIKQREGNYE